MKNNFLTICFLILSLTAKSQYGNLGTIPYPPPSFDPRYLEYETGTRANNYNQLILPGALILYGFLSLHTDALADVNEGIKDGIWTKAPHQKVPIDTYLQFVPAVAAFSLNIAGVQGEHDLLDAAMIYTLSNLILGVTVFSLKYNTHEERPDGSNYYSFPSGHTAEAFASAEFLRQEYKNVSVWYGIGGYLVAASVAYLRIYNNKHWLGDVVAGAGFGMMSTRISYMLYPKIKKMFVHTKMKDSMIMPFYQDKTFGLSFVHSFR